MSNEEDPSFACNPIGFFSQFRDTLSNYESLVA